MNSPFNIEDTDLIISIAKDDAKKEKHNAYVMAEKARQAASKAGEAAGEVIKLNNKDYTWNSEVIDKWIIRLEKYKRLKKTIQSENNYTTEIQQSK